nr:hypothetical protein [Tanacetum cinerariifolium]
MNERCSAVLLNKLPSKAEDPGSFTIPCDISQLHINNALAYLGASISLMPYTMYEKISLGEPKSTRMSLELANRSIKYPRGIVENVLIKVDKFVLPIDFVILDILEDFRVPIILGRPFLATARAMIDVFNKKITLRVGDNEVIFDMDQSIKRSPTEDDECYGVGDLDDAINAEAQGLLENDTPDSFLLKGLEKSNDQSDLESYESYECKAVDDYDSGEQIRRIESVNTQLRKEKEGAQRKKFLQNLKQLHINLPFIEAVAQIPKYAKFLKGLLKNKARLEETCTITMNERCSAVLLNKLPSKAEDPGSFTIPCDISQLHINNALAYLGASISLMPYTMYEKISLGEPKSTRMSLELANRSIKYPRGIVENVLIKVDKFVLPIDFVILDILEDFRVPIILGRPFLATARAMIDVFNKKITLRVGDNEVIFDMDQSIKRSPTEDDECYGVGDLDDAINAEAQGLLENDTPDSFLLKGLEKSNDQSDLESYESYECKAVDDYDSGEQIRRFFQIQIPKDQEKTTFTCLYGTFAYRRMSFGLCNTPATFQRCMMVIFHDLVEDFMKVFMDNFLVFGHKISRAGIEADRAKIDVIAKFPYPTNVKGDEPYAFKLCSDNVMRRCVAGDEIRKILAHCHSGPTRGHHSASITGRKVYESGFFWPSIFKDAKDYVMRCDTCQRSGNISSRNEMPQNNIQCVRKHPVYKEITKRWHNSRLRGDKNFKVGDGVLLFNSRFKMHPGKLKSRWYGPNVVKPMYPYGTVEIIDRKRISSKVNGQRLKKYHDELTDAEDKEIVEFEEDTM